MSHFGSLVESLASLSVPVKRQQEIPVQFCAQPSPAPVLGHVPVCCAPQCPWSTGFCTSTLEKLWPNTAPCTTTELLSFVSPRPSLYPPPGQGKIFMYEHYYGSKIRYFKTSVILSQNEKSL